MFELRSPALASAVSNIQMRAEHETVEESLASIYVDNGLLRRLENRSNQILVGRRGTGKTHLLLALSNLRQVRNADLRYVYIDLRRIHSTGQNPAKSVQVVADEFFLKVLELIQAYVTEVVCALELPGEEDRRAAQTAWEQLVDLLASPRDPGTGAFHYEQIRVALETLLFRCRVELLTLLVDEWVNVPWEAQPFFAEHLRQFVLPSKLVKLKIASIEFQANYLSRSNHRKAGFELGADISCDVDMDSYLVYDKDEEHVLTFFAQVLFNHLAIRVFENDQQTKLPIDEKQAAIVQSLFSHKGAFAELVRACEGVARDLLQIFAIAFFEFYIPRQAGGRDRIDIPAIRKAAREWYNKDKHASIQSAPSLNGLLKDIITRVIGQRKARAFMVRQELSRHPLLQELFDSRIIHRLRKGWSHPDRPGERYDIFALDYGAYVDLMATKNQPQLFLPDGQSPGAGAEDIIVPFDDRRSIRRVVLEQELLDQHHRGAASG
jgi:predicted ABC-type transport system involved in lysophospholipase L1 biosynthesis ATPase subunit